MEIRLATTRDAESILEIYSPYVKNTAISFEYDVPGIDEFRARITKTLKDYPYLVAVDGGKIIGYAYASILHGRIAYQHSCEVSIYVDESLHFKGVGKKLYEELERQLLKQNVFNLYACIAATERNYDENLTDGSILFHEKIGYKAVGRHNLCGYKFGKWYSVVWMEKILTERKEKPMPFIPFSALESEKQKIK